MMRGAPQAHIVGLDVFLAIEGWGYHFMAWPTLRLVEIATNRVSFATRAITGSLKNQCFSIGTPLAGTVGMNRKIFVTEYHGNNRATFECASCGHTFRRQLMKRDPRGKLPAEVMLQKMA